MFPIYLMDKKKVKIDDDIYYLVAKNGVFVKKKLGLIESLTPVEGIPFLAGTAVPYAKMTIPKIPKEAFCKILSFFRKIYSLYRSECEVFLLYSSSKEKFEIRVPYQKVSYASCEAVRMGSPKDYAIICSIHSHANFSAFHSGDDIKDEEHFEGLHITIGDVPDIEFSVVASIVSNKKRFKVNPLDYVEGLVQTCNQRRALYAVSGSDEIEFDPEWLKFVERKYPVFVQNREGLPFYGHGVYGNRQFTSIMDIKDLIKNVKNGKDSKVKTVTYRQNDPCLVCPFKKETSEDEKLQEEELVLDPDEAKEFTGVEDLFSEYCY
jgi:proteasome lid subunit RPN8/RPN11